MMETVKLPTEKAHEPDEEARQPLCDNTMSSQEESNKGKKRQAITFADDVVPSEASQNTSVYKEALSQPQTTLSHKHRLAWLQRRRAPGLWAQCDACDAWRHLPHALEAHQLPDKWYCSMNPDKSMADCSIPETPLRITEQEDLIHSEYSAGSLVWARLPGWPWWPAMVDDCPDTEQFYWLDGFSDIPTHYNVVFFDATEVTRAWIAPENLKPYTSNKSKVRHSKQYMKRLQKAVQKADKAERLPVLDRLAEFSFISTFKGPIVTPRKVSKREIEKFQNKLKRKFNVEFPIEVSSESEDETVRAFKENNKKNNVIIIGTPKSRKANRDASTKSTDKAKRSKNDKPKAKKPIIDENDANESPKPIKEKKDDTNKKTRNIVKDMEKKSAIEPQSEEIENREAMNTVDTEAINEILQQKITNGDSTDTFKRPNSMTIEIGSTQTQDFGSDMTGLDNDSSKTYVPVAEEESNPVVVTPTQDFSIRIETPNSDDFDF